MATEDDNFDIDIYGDGSGYNTTEQGDQNQDDTELVLDAPEATSSAPSADTKNPNNTNHTNNTNNAPVESNRPIESAPASNGDHAMTNPQTSAHDASAPPHGVKRKDYDDRPSDPDATSALLISDLFWWETDDDIRGWIAAAGSEDELKDVTFSEHKVNGKSKGQAFVEFTTPQAATASKHTIETGSSGRKHLVNYTSPHQNPFRTLPKDAPMRKDANRPMGGNFNAGGNQNNNYGMNMGGGYRGGRGGFNNRGMGGNNFNNRGNYNNMGGGFQGGGGGPGMMGGFQGAPMGGMQNYGFNNRGGGMMGGMRGGPGGMRGGRGGNMGGNNMMGMPGMNPMAGGMGMNPMAGGMNPMMSMGMQGQGFQGGNPAFNQGFFNNQGGSGGGGNDASWNPHGAKRSRQE